MKCKMFFWEYYTKDEYDQESRKPMCVARNGWDTDERISAFLAQPGRKLVSITQSSVNMAPVLAFGGRHDHLSR